MPITSSALGAMPPSSIQTFVNYSYCIDHLLKEINVTLNLNLILPSQTSVLNTLVSSLYYNGEKYAHDSFMSVKHFINIRVLYDIVIFKVLNFSKIVFYFTSLKFVLETIVAIVKIIRVN